MKFLAVLLALVAFVVAVAAFAISVSAYTLAVPVEDSEEFSAPLEESHHI